MSWSAICRYLLTILPLFISDTTGCVVNDLSIPSDAVSFFQRDWIQYSNENGVVGSSATSSTRKIKSTTASAASTRSIKRASAVKGMTTTVNTEIPTTTPPAQTNTTGSPQSITATTAPEPCTCSPNGKALAAFGQNRKSGCADKEYTGFIFGGSPATCATMRKFCTDPDYASNMRFACPETCCAFIVEQAKKINATILLPTQAQYPKLEVPMGRSEANESNVSDPPQTPTSLENAGECEDNEAVPCRLLLGDCNSSKYGSQLRRDCPMSCGVCGQTAAWNAELRVRNVTKASVTKAGPCKDNSLLPCEKLVDKCFSPLDGERVQAVCPASCGLCLSSLNVQLRGSSQTQSSEGFCSDRTGINIDEDIIHCSELVHQCKSSVLSKQIQAACPKTCGVCSFAEESSNNSNNEAGGIRLAFKEKWK